MYLRWLQPGDANRLHALDVLCFDERFRFSKSAMRRFAEATNALTLLAVEADGITASETVLGFCIVHLEAAGAGVAGYVVTLDVDPGVRGKGVATRLMTALEGAAGKSGASAMRLHVFGDNVAAISLYERLGYGRTGTTANFYGAGLDAVEYERALHDGGAEATESPEVTGRHGGRTRAS